MLLSKLVYSPVPFVLTYFNVCCRYIGRSLHQIKLGSLETHIKSRLSDWYCSRGQEICDDLCDCKVC
ncbi:hypothetical protein Hanom_Chr14g01321231 [Helianthus anomalus]